MITRNDVVRLLALAARGDQRTVGADDVDDWHTIARLHRWDARAAARVIIEHRASGAHKPRITPAHITDRLRELRAQAAETFDTPTIPPTVLDHEYPQWLRDRLAEHVDRQLAQWAGGGPEPHAQALPTRTVPDPHPDAVRWLAEVNSDGQPTASDDQRGQHMSAIGDLLPKPRDTDQRMPADEMRAVKRVPCPWCQARPLHDCTRPGTNHRIAGVHPSRVDAARHAEETR